ncbi:hypothetical protein D3C80_1404770 [compost metagenome]
MQFIGVQTQYILQQLIRFTDKLHVAVFDAVVNHFDIVSGTVFTDISRARIAIHLGRNGCQDRLHQLVGILLSTRHNCRSLQRPFFTARYSCPDKTEALCLKLFVPSLGIREKGVPAVNQDIPWRQMRHQLLNRIICRFAGLDHDHDFARQLERLDKLLNAVGTDEVFARCFCKQLICFLAGTVVQGYREPLALHIQGQILTHDG